MMVIDMNKLLTINRCHDCYYCHIADSWCHRENRGIGDTGSIPEWCGLPDAIENYCSFCGKGRNEHDFDGHCIA